MFDSQQLYSGHNSRCAIDLHSLRMDLGLHANSCLLDGSPYLGYFEVHSKAYGSYMHHKMTLIDLRHTDISHLLHSILQFMIENDKAIIYVVVYSQN